MCVAEVKSAQPMVSDEELPKLAKLVGTLTDANEPKSEFCSFLVVSKSGATEKLLFEDGWTTVKSPIGVVDGVLRAVNISGVFTDCTLPDLNSPKPNTVSEEMVGSSEVALRTSNAANLSVEAVAVLNSPNSVFEAAGSLAAVEIGS